MARARHRRDAPDWIDRWLAALLAIPFSRTRPLALSRTAVQSQAVGSHLGGHGRVSSAAIEVNGMSVRYGTLTALGDFDFVASERTVTAVIGPNGSGKTTFLNALTGAVPYQTGRVTVLGTSVERATPGLMHRMGLSRTFQNLDLMDDLSVEDNVKLGAACGSRASLIEAALALPRTFRVEAGAHGERPCGARSARHRRPRRREGQRALLRHASACRSGARRSRAHRRCCYSTSPPPGWDRTRARSSRPSCCTSATSWA